MASDECAEFAAQASGELLTPRAADLFEYLQDIDERLSAELARIASSIAALHALPPQRPPSAQMAQMGNGRVTRRGVMADSSKEIPALAAHRQKFLRSASQPLTGAVVQPNKRIATEPLRIDRISARGEDNNSSGDETPQRRSRTREGLITFSNAVGQVRAAVAQSGGGDQKGATSRDSVASSSVQSKGMDSNAEDSDSDCVVQAVLTSRNEESLVSVRWCLHRNHLQSAMSGASLNQLFEPRLSTTRPTKRVLMPGCGPRLAWDILVMFVSIAVIIFTPMDLVYFLQQGTEVLFLRLCLLSVVDLLWILDILLNFRTAFLSQGRVVCDLRLIAAAYARSWLIADVLTAWPVLLVPTRALTVLRILKMARLVRVVHLVDGLQKELRSALLLPPLKMLLLGFLAAHLLACAWRLAQRADVRVMEPEAESASTCGDHYLLDVYWVMVTVTTCGYGDITPAGRSGRVLAIFALLLAPWVNGVIVCVSSHVTKHIFDDDVHAQVVAAARFMQQREVPLELQRRVEHNLRGRLRPEHQLASGPGLLAKLSANMQRELTLALLRSTVCGFPVFTGAPVAFAAEIAQAHSWIECGAGDLVAEEGQLEEDLVFLVVGELLQVCTSSMMMCDVLSTSHTPLQAGAWFGEACLFQAKTVRGNSLFARVDSQLVALQASDYHAVIKKYPLLALRHKSIEHEIRSGKLDLESLGYQAPPPKPPVVKRVWSSFSGPFGRAAKVADEPPFNRVLC